MAKSDDGVTLEFLQEFADAWNRHDLDALMEFMADECVYETSSGEDVFGTRYAGTEAVRKGFASIWEMFPDAQWLGASHFIAGNRGVSEWIFTGTGQDGKKVEVNGCDVFTFRDSKIAIKNSYRKNRPPLD
jgi:steroid delta-isomerase-like uncharacterized protein